MSNPTLGEAVEHLRWVREDGPIAYACIGGPYCCAIRYRQHEQLQHEQLQRAAHIVVKQLVDLVEVRRG